MAATPSVRVVVAQSTGAPIRRRAPPRPARQFVPDGVGFGPYIKTLDSTKIPFPGYHPGTKNDEVHNDFKEQFVFEREDGMDEFDGVHGELKRYVTDGRLWYVLVHTTPQRNEEFMFSEYVMLFVLGKSPHGDHCVGLVTHQVCHNLCD